MIKTMLGAPLGGTTRGGHHGVESLALSLITPPKGSDGGGSCLPSSVIVALGEPGTPLICWARAALAFNRQATVNAASSDTLRSTRRLVLIVSSLPSPVTGSALHLPCLPKSSVMPHDLVIIVIVGRRRRWIITIWIILDNGGLRLWL